MPRTPKHAHSVVKDPEAFKAFQQKSDAEQTADYRVMLRKIPKTEEYAAGRVFFEKVLDTCGPDVVTNILAKYVANAHSAYLSPGEETLLRQTRTPLVLSVAPIHISRRAMLKQAASFAHNVFVTTALASVVMDVADALIGPDEAEVLKKKVEQDSAAAQDASKNAKPATMDRAGFLRTIFRENAPNIEHAQRKMVGDKAAETIPLIALVAAAHQYMLTQSFNKKLQEVATVAEKLSNGIGLTTPQAKVVAYQL